MNNKNPYKYIPTFVYRFNSLCNECNHDREEYIPLSTNLGYINSGRVTHSNLKLVIQQ